jgi:hypothetical protein
MRSATQRYPWQPLTMTWAEVATTVFRRSESWLRDHLPDDFPRPDPAYGLFATEAVQTWVRRRFDLARPTRDPHDAEDILIRRANGQN